MEAAVIMSTVLLLLAAVMGSARRNAQAISSYGEKAYLYYLEYSGDFGTEVQNI